MKVLNGLDLGGQRITSLADPSASADAANKNYVDSVARGLQWKFPVRAASTTNVTVSAPGTTLDGVTLAANDRILLKNQTTASENGIYIWTASGSALTRSLDADGGTELSPGAAVSVNEGTVNADTVYHIISDAPITIGTTAMVWGQLSGSATYTASNGVQLSGGNFSGVAAPGGGVLVGPTGFYVDTTVMARKISGTLGNGSLTTIAVTHALGTKDVQVGLREVATDAGVMTDWVATDANTVTFTFGVAPATGAYRWTIEG